VLEGDTTCGVSLTEGGSWLQLAGLEVAILNMSIATARHQGVLEVEARDWPSAGVVNVIEGPSVA